MTTPGRLPVTTTWRFLIRLLAIIPALLTVLVLATGSHAASPITKHDRQLIRFFQHHPKLARTPAGAAVLAQVLPRVVRALQDAQPYWPPHHQLWDCIARYEGARNPDGTVNWQTGAGTQDAHDGGLEMQWNWGYGITGNAGDYSQHDQEWAAERGFAASGYSWSFLYGQWYEWDAAAGCGG